MELSKLNVVVAEFNKEKTGSALFLKTFRKDCPDFKIYIKLINQHLKKVK